MKQLKSLIPLTILITIILFPAFSKGTAPSSNPAASFDNETYNTMLDSADHYINEEKWENAEKIIENLLRSDPANPMNIMLLANLTNIKLSLEKYDEATALADVVLSRTPNSVKMLNLKSKILIADNKVYEAIEPLEKSLATDSSQVWVCELLGAININAGNLNKGLEYYRHLHSLHPQNNEYLRTIASTLMQISNYDEAESVSRELITLNDDPQAYQYLITILINKGDITEAEKIARQAIEKHPENGNLYALRGVIYKIQYQSQEAQAALNLAKKYNAEPQFIEMLNPKKRK